jgi:lipopolysaccharide transport system ATP-binding protein
MKGAIRVENIGKCYRIDHTTLRNNYRTLRESLVSLATLPLRRLRNGDTQKEAFWALKDIQFDLEPGEVLGIIGPNGSGKSTLLKILSRVTKPTTGQIKIDGHVGSLLEVGTGFHPELTGRENVFLNGAILGMKKTEIKEKFADIVAFSGIEKFLDTPVKRYSSGMYVRLAFAVAAHLQPDILVVDEVLAVGDAQFQEKCMGAMKKTATSGRTILFVSHNMASVQQLCTRAILLKQGRIVADGPPQEIVKYYFADAQEVSTIALHDWPDRMTNGQARIVQLDIADDSGHRTSRIPFGSGVRFAIHAEFRDPLLDPMFGVLVQSGIGEPILDIRSTHDALRLGRVQGSIVVQVAVDQLGLYPGQYLLSPWITDSACSSDVDFVKHCCILRVEHAPSAQKDLKLDPMWGKYWVPSKWSVQ